MACEICDKPTEENEELCPDCKADEIAINGYSEGDNVPDRALDRAVFMGYC